eukprot:TRINITY_DN778_c0_g1_i3.p1 TRINITY_DN778_c0_g1~~TRINITY_DN778_c0_g1_i3.p1  ORF type:complete len:522 (+),score=96.62 TRINITY_DN778_c0_g1_i3:47-1567(+)
MAARVEVLRGHVQTAPAGTAASEAVDVVTDFRSPWSYLSLPQVLTVPKDFTCILRWHPCRLESWLAASGVGTRDSSFYRHHQRLREAHDTANACRYAEIMGVTIDARRDPDCTAGLYGLMWTSRKAPTVATDYVVAAAKAVWEAGGDLSTVAATEVVLRSSGAPTYGFANFVSSGDAERALKEEQHSMGVPSYCYRGEWFHGREYLSLVRYRLLRAGLARRRGVVSDLPILWRFPERALGVDTVGMPAGPRDPTATYRLNSARRWDGPDAPHVDVYIDVKSPHAFLSVEMAQAIEHDFAVNVRLLPFDINLREVFGAAEVGSTDNKVKAGSSTRTKEQYDRLRQGYKLVKAEGAVRGYRMYGTKKVWNTRLALLGMLWASRTGGRATLGRYLDAVLRPFWRREVDVEDVAEIKQRLTTAGSDASSFETFAEAGGEGDEQLRAIRAEADARGVFGVPTFCFRGEVFFGKENLSFVRLRLKQAGLGREGAPVDVPYHWRPGGVATKLR